MKFEIYQSEKNKEYYFRLKAGNGENILGSEGYKAKSGCTNGIESVMKNATDEHHFEAKEAKNGKWHFNLKAANGQVIGSSQLYSTKAGMQKGIQSVMKNAPEASIDDTTA